MLNTASGIHRPLHFHNGEQLLAEDQAFEYAFSVIAKFFLRLYLKIWFGPWIPGLYIRLELHIHSFYLNKSKKLLKS